MFVARATHHLDLARFGVVEELIPEMRDEFKRNSLPNRP